MAVFLMTINVRVLLVTSRHLYKVGAAEVGDSVVNVFSTSRRCSSREESIYVLTTSPPSPLLRWLAFDDGDHSDDDDDDGDESDDAF